MLGFTWFARAPAEPAQGQTERTNRGVAASPNWQNSESIDLIENSATSVEARQLRPWC
jgi:hypothetical protein